MNFSVAPRFICRDLINDHKHDSPRTGAGSTALLIESALNKLGKGKYTAQ